MGDVRPPFLRRWGVVKQNSGRRSHTSFVAVVPARQVSGPPPAAARDPLAGARVAREAAQRTRAIGIGLTTAFACIALLRGRAGRGTQGLQRNCGKWGGGAHRHRPRRSGCGVKVGYACQRGPRRWAGFQLRRGGGGSIEPHAPPPTHEKRVQLMGPPEPSLTKPRVLERKEPWGWGGGSHPAWPLGLWRRFAKNRKQEK